MNDSKDTAKITPEQTIEELGLNPDITYKVAKAFKDTHMWIGNQPGGLTPPDDGKVLYPPHGRSEDMVFLTNNQFEDYERAKFQYDIGVNRDRLEAAVSGNPFQETKRQEATSNFLERLKDEELSRQSQKVDWHYPGFRR